MVHLLEELVGHRCSIMGEDGEYLSGSADVTCEVLATDGEWIKVMFTDPTGRDVVRLERMEFIESVRMYKN